MADETSSGADRIQPIDINEEMQTSYIDYAMSVIVGRALPEAVSYTHLTLPTILRV